jgi:hypothetical protein
MEPTMLTRIRIFLALLALTSVAQVLAQDTSAKPVRIRGEIVSYSGNVMVVKRRDADMVQVDVKPDLAVAALKAIQLADIQPGNFIGTAATSGRNGKLTALEVLVFPEAARGTGEGHYDWDLGPTTSMTNANVDAVVKSTHGRELKLSYKGGSNVVTVPKDVPIVTFTSASHADLTTGKQVFVVATPVDAKTFSAVRIVVEKDGVVPPM